MPSASITPGAPRWRGIWALPITFDSFLLLSFTFVVNLPFSVSSQGPEFFKVVDGDAQRRAVDSLASRVLELTR